MQTENKVLMVAMQEIVEDLSDGGKRASNRNWKLLKDIFGNHNVTLVMYTNNKGCSHADIIRLPAYRNILDRGINICAGRFFARKDSEEYVADMIVKNEYDLVFLDRALYGALVDRIKEADCGCRIWVFSHNLEADYFRKKLRRYPGISGFICSKVKKSEAKTVQMSDTLFVLTLRDAELNEKIYGKKAYQCIPCSFEDRYCEALAPADGETKQLLFIGTMFGPNYDGIKWFVENVMRELREYTLTIVGKNFETRKNNLQRSNVVVVGTVEDLEDYYYADNIMVIPVFYGAGQKVKTAEAMMYGKTIIATSEALEGYSVDDVEGIFRCDTSEAFVRTIRRVSSLHRCEYRKAVRKRFLEEYSYKAVLDKAKNCLNAL